MVDVLEVSSDSNDTVIISPKRNFMQEDSDSDVEALVNKYISQNYEEAGNKNTTEENFMHLEIGNDDSDLGVPSVKRLKQLDDHQLKYSLPLSSSSYERGVDDSGALQVLHEKYKKNILDEKPQFDAENIEPSSVQSKKLEKALQKQKTIEERRQKKKELEKQKSLQQVLAAASKAVKPEDLKKFVTVEIDNNIPNEEYSNEIISALQDMDVQYKFISQIFSHTITWTRRTQSHSLDDDGKLVSTYKEQDEEQVLLMMSCKEFVEHIHNSTLSGHIQSLKSVLINKKITLIVYGLQSYIRFVKNQHQKEMRRNITGENEKPTTSKACFQDFPKITEKMIEYGLTELQLLCSCSHRLIDAATHLGSLVAQFTKAVAEIPFKLQRYEKFQQTDWFAAGDNRDSVKVDKSGNGLNRLWNQVLTTFPMARLETAEAISAQYPTLSALMEAYEDCESSAEAESLLQDIPVRRAAGPLSSSRKIGPELSKKICNFFTSTDGDRLL